MTVFHSSATCEATFRLRGWKGRSNPPKTKSCLHGGVIENGRTRNPLTLYTVTYTAQVPKGQRRLGVNLPPYLYSFLKFPMRVEPIPVKDFALSAYTTTPGKVFQSDIIILSQKCSARVIVIANYSKSWDWGFFSLLYSSKIN